MADDELEKLKADRLAALALDDTERQIEEASHGGPRDFGFDTLKLPFEPDEWCDADERMFQACFAILGQYVEDELGREAWFDPDDLYRGYRLHSADIPENDPSGAPAGLSIDRTAIDLWLWYKDELPKLEEDYDKSLIRFISGKKTEDFEYDYPEQVKDEKLAALMKIRRALWT